MTAPAARCASLRSASIAFAPSRSPRLRAATIPAMRCAACDVSANAACASLDTRRQPAVAALGAVPAAFAAEYRWATLDQSTKFHSLVT